MRNSKATLDMKSTPVTISMKIIPINNLVEIDEYAIRSLQGSLPAANHTSITIDEMTATIVT
jgi:hypothetical protein